MTKTLNINIFKQIEETIKKTIIQHLQLVESVYDDGSSSVTDGLFGVAEDENDLSGDDSSVDADEVNVLDDWGPRVPLDENMKRPPARRKDNDWRERVPRPRRQFQDSTSFDYVTLQKGH